MALLDMWSLVSYGFKVETSLLSTVVEEDNTYETVLGKY